MKRDLARGKKGELKVTDIFNSFGYETESNIVKGQLSDYDIKIIKDELSFTIEVKNDEYAKRSGNVAIEVFNPKSNKASGLSATKANFWAQVLDDEVWITTVDKLREFTKTAKPHKIIDVGGDNNATLMLYKKEDILNEIFTRIDNIDKLALEFYLKGVAGIVQEEQK